MVLEAWAAMHYDRRIGDLHFWRSAAGHEVDLLIDEHTAVELKAGRVHEGDGRGLAALADDMRLRHRWIVTTEPKPRRLATGVDVLPWREYLDRVWSWPR